ncbi:maker464 [Drosophila busckii]|uniref:Gamma-tubulin complex component n=1 Tax=Drosophila busckii TaxID=30019 RepID=A0A0M5IYC9_DROBS|nr:maker464 [Drosophila busckii]
MQTETNKVENQDNLSEQLATNGVEDQDLNEPLDQDFNEPAAEAAEATATDLPQEIRTSALWDFYEVNGHESQTQLKLEELPFKQQEQLLMNDLIHVAIGMCGDYIKPKPREDPDDCYEAADRKYVRQFEFNFVVDETLLELVQQILPLASHFVGMQLIIAETDAWGQTNKALNVALGELTSDYYEMMQRLEQELMLDRLTLIKLLYYLEPTIWSMSEIFETLVQLERHNYRGAALLTYLCHRIKLLEGYALTQEIFIKLTKGAARPYMEMLQIWLQKGVIVDKYDEFLIEARAQPVDYWAHSYAVRIGCIPSFLQQAAEKILRTGKYLNVVRKCGKRFEPLNLQLDFNPSNNQHLLAIDAAFDYAARLLLDVLHEHDLLGHLLAMKRYFLLQQGDFILQFMDECEQELSQSVSQLLPINLEHLLQIVLGFSTDPYKDNLHCELHAAVTTTTGTELNAFDCFSFGYAVDWPICLVLNQRAIGKYQQLFRQLFYCKHVERQLSNIWKDNATAKQLNSTAPLLYQAAFGLRQRMLNAIQNLEYYMLIEVIEPHWHLFTQKLTQVQNMDALLELHEEFLDLCLKHCMIAEALQLHQAIRKLCGVCLKFCAFIKTTESQQLLKSSQLFTFFDERLSSLLITFLKQIIELTKNNTTDCFRNVVHRINFNG